MILKFINVALFAFFISALTNADPIDTAEAESRTVWSKIIETDANENFFKFKLADNMGAKGCAAGNWLKVPRFLRIYTTRTKDTKFLINDNSSFLISSALTAYGLDVEVSGVGFCETPSIMRITDLKTRKN